MLHLPKSQSPPSPEQVSVQNPAEKTQENSQHEEQQQHPGGNIQYAVKDSQSFKI